MDVPALSGRSALAGARLPATAALICRDEAHCIAGCLESLADCGEIVVVDSGSTDGTLDIVADFAQRGFPIRLFRQPWLGFARQKQFAMDRATQPWIFIVDADERLDDDLRAALPELLAAEPTLAGWRVRRRPAPNGARSRFARWMRPDVILRLVRAGRARFDESRLVHEALAPDGPTRVAPRGALLHQVDISDGNQLAKHIRYAELKARQRVAQGRRPRAMRLLLAPPLYFARLYFRDRYFLCGRDGLAHAAIGALYALATEIAHYQLERAKPGSTL